MYVTQDVLSCFANTPISYVQAKLLPQYLNSLGFSSHIVGKWHLGHHTQAHTPTFRGFESHTGYWLGKEDYYDHSDDNGKPVHFSDFYTR